jgi:4-hydroxy-2-oxoglutarate aldolase
MSPTGLFHPLITPFNDDGRLDEQGLASNAKRLLEAPLAGLVVLGSNGEQPQLDDEECERAIAAVRAVVPRGRPLMAGVGRESTRATIAAARQAAAAGADFVMARTPSFYKNMMTSDVFVRHFTAVADAAPVPVLLYNVTMYTSVTLQADAVATLSHHPNIVGIKESGNDMQLLADYLAGAKDGFSVLCGSATSLFTALSLGVHGAVLALAGLAPVRCARLIELVRSGRINEARALQRQLLPLARAIGAQHGVPALKAALGMLGFAAGPPRPPLVPAPPAVVESLRVELARLGLVAQPEAERS